MAQNDQQQQQQPQQQQFQQMQGGGLDFSNFMPQQQQQQQQQQQGMNSFQLFSQAQPQAGFASGAGFPGAGAFGGGLGGLGGDFSVYGGGSKPTEQQQQQQAYATQQAAMYQQPALMNAQMLAMQQGFQQSQFAQFPQPQQPRQQSYTSLTGVPPVGQQQQQQHHNNHNQNHQGGGRGHGRNPPRQQGPEISWDEWMSRLDGQVVAKIRELISEGHLTDRGLDSGCLEELSRNPPQAALTTLATFREVVSNPKTHQPVNNPSAYLTRMLKNPHQPGGGYNGRGGGRGGRGRGRGGQRYDPEHAAEVEQMLRDSFGEVYDQLDDGAQNFARKSTKEAISHLCEEWQTQVASNNEVKNISAWATKILISHRSKPTSAQPHQDPQQGQIQPASAALQAQAQALAQQAAQPAASTEAAPAAAAQE